MKTYKNLEGYTEKRVSMEITEIAGDESRVVKGYGSVFGNLDSDLDTIKKGSFNRTIKAWGPEGKNRIKLCSQHILSKPVAKITKLIEDEKGLYFEAVFGTHRDGEDHYRMVKEGILTEFSVGFVGLQYEDNEFGGKDFEEIKLYEISLVTVASNDEALVTDVKAGEVVEAVVDKVAELDKEKAHEVEALLLKLAKRLTENTQPAVEAPVSLDEKSAENDLLTELAERLSSN